MELKELYAHLRNPWSFYSEVGRLAADEIDRLQAELAKAQDELQDWKDSAEKAWKYPCPDEKHCACVPVLSKALDDLEKEKAEMVEVVKEISLLCWTKMIDLPDAMLEKIQCIVEKNLVTREELAALLEKGKP